MSYHVYDTYTRIQGNTEGEKGQSRRVWHAAFHRLCSQVALHHRRHHHQHCHHRCHQLAIRWLLEPFLRHRHHHYHIILTGGLKQQVRQNLSLVFHHPIYTSSPIKANISIVDIIVAIVVIGSILLIYHLLSFLMMINPFVSNQKK